MVDVWFLPRGNYITLFRDRDPKCTRYKESINKYTRVCRPSSEVAGCRRLFPSSVWTPAPGRACAWPGRARARLASVCFLFDSVQPTGVYTLLRPFLRGSVANGER